MAKKQIDNLSQMQNDLKHAIREYYLTDNKESILTIQELSTKMAVLHGFESTVMADADSYAVRLDEHCKKMAMTYSYKAVMILGLLGNAKDIKPKSIEAMAKYFIRYYASRIRRGLKTEKNGLFSQPNPDYEQVVKYLKYNQIKSLQREGVIDFDGITISFSNRVSTEDKAWARKAKKACTERLEEYFARMQDGE